MKIKDSLTFPFVMWMSLGDHSLSGKKDIIMKRNSKDGTAPKVARIYMSDNDYHAMNDYCKQRYELFLKQWFNNGISFIEDLTMKGNIEVMRNRQKSYLELAK